VGSVDACSETLFGSLKVEQLHGKRFITRRHAKDETLAWLLWYNQARLHSTLDFISPMQFGRHWLAKPNKPAHSPGYGVRNSRARSDLRHTWAAWHAQSGTPLNVVQELAG